ncbi:MAG TPA: iron uptake transporter permease EfeU [Nocardioides sp.]|uniref:iron uptake transporter permease EfeU n=1 Tax=Nocardioides sp. TaxID=35761 RepID=UPI002E37A639|nr:iron uptake transporter permease EfeU [Nocardioides sp.]HEX5087063.1 iron uptake transporter permease EfeU [Nocardioides sp.]
MLPTFVIGLREGLEAVLIVSIIATFLRRNGQSLRAMWIGALAAVALSIGVGVALQVVNQSLPQREQEGMETVIGFVAVFFVTGMILWMRKHARFMKRELEGAAEAALRHNTTTALVVMVFLAVLREGFETSVFLLSTFQASSSPATSAGGAVLGILVAIAIGYGIYKGGVRLNLARFFKITGVFLVFVAAGLVLTSLRTAQEAGWIGFGQGTTVDLSWLAPPGAVRTALISGVLGMPRDPRQVELLGWACYLVPVLAITLWPAAWRLSARGVTVARRAGAGVLAAGALSLFLVVPVPSTAVAADAPLDGGGTARVAVSGDRGTLTTQTGTATTTWALVRPTSTASSGADTSWTLESANTDLPATLDLATLLAYTGHKIPVGLDINRAPGPYDAAWDDRVTGTVLTRDGGLVDAHGRAKLVLTVSGGGLESPRVFSVDSGGAELAVTRAHVAQVASAVLAGNRTRGDRELWKYWFPGLLLVAAAALAAQDVRRRATAPPATRTDAVRTSERGRIRAPAVH